MFKVVHLRPRLDNAVSSSRDRAFPLDATLTMIQTLIDCDEFQDIATLRVCQLYRCYRGEIYTRRLAPINLGSFKSTALKCYTIFSRETSFPNLTRESH